MTWILEQQKDEKNDSDNISSNSKNNVRKLPKDENGHGTFLAAIAAGREDIDQIFFRSGS